MFPARDRCREGPADPPRVGAVTAPAPLPPPSTTRSPAARAAALLTALEAVALAGFAGFYGYEIAVGASADVAGAVMSTLLIVVFAVGLGMLARAWVRGGTGARTPTLVWNALLLPVAWSLAQAGLGVAAAAVGLVAVGGLAAAALAGSPEAAGPG